MCLLCYAMVICGLWCLWLVCGTSLSHTVPFRDITQVPAHIQWVSITEADWMGSITGFSPCFPENTVRQDTTDNWGVEGGSATQIRYCDHSGNIKVSPLGWGFLVNWEYIYFFFLQFTGKTPVAWIMELWVEEGKVYSVRYVCVCVCVCVCVWSGRGHFLRLESADNRGTHITCPPPVPIATCAGLSSCEAFAANLFAPWAPFE